MLYFCNVKKTDDGYVGIVSDVELETLPQPTQDEAINAIKQGFSAWIELNYRKRKKPIPLPHATETEYAFSIPIKLQLRILLWNAMLSQYITQTELAEKLGISKAHMNQFFITDNVSVEKYEEALQVLGHDVSVSIC